MDFKLSLFILLVIVVVYTNGTFYHFTTQYPVTRYHIGYSHGQRILWCKYPSGRTKILRQWPLYTPKLRTITMNTANLINFQNNLRLRKNMWSNAVLPGRQTAFGPRVLRSDAIEPSVVSNALIPERSNMWDVLGIDKNSAGLDNNGQIQKVMNDPIFILFPPVDLSKLKQEQDKTPTPTETFFPETGYKTKDPTIASDKLDTNVLDPINIPVDPVVLETLDKPNIVKPIEPVTIPIPPPIVPAVLDKVADSNIPDTTSVPIVPITIDNGPSVPVPIDNGPTVPVTIDNGPSVPVIIDNGPTVPVTVDNGPTVPVTIDNGPSVPVTIDNGPSVPVTIDNGPSVPVTIDNGPTVPVTVDNGPSTPVTTDNEHVVPITIDNGLAIPVPVDNGPVDPIVVPAVDATIVASSSDTVVFGTDNSLNLKPDTINPDLSKITDILPPIDGPQFVDSVITNEIIDPVIPGKLPTDNLILPPVIDNPAAAKDQIGLDNLPTPTAVVPITDVLNPKPDPISPVKPPKEPCQITGCGQGSTCVSSTDGSICLPGMLDKQCECRLGCQLGPNFIPLGSSLTVDECGNICGCNNMFGQTECTQYMCNPDAIGTQTPSPNFNDPFSKTDISFPVSVPNANSITNDVINPVNNNNVIFPQNNPVDLNSVTQDLPGLSFPQGQLQSVVPETREFINAPEPNAKLPNTNIPDATQMVNPAVHKASELVGTSGIKGNDSFHQLEKDANLTALSADIGIEGLALESISKTKPIVNSESTITNELIKNANGASGPLLNSGNVLTKDTGLDTKQIVISKQSSISASENHVSSETKLLVHTNKLDSNPIQNNNALMNDNQLQLENGFVKNAKIFVENKVETTTQKLVSTSDSQSITATQQGNIVTKTSVPTEKTNQVIPVTTSSTMKEKTNTTQRTSQSSTKQEPVSISASVTEPTYVSTQPIV